MSGLVKMLRSEVQAAPGPDQLGNGVQVGCAKGHYAAQTVCRQSIEKGILARDIPSAHQCLHRKHAAEELACRSPPLLQPFVAWYGGSTTHVWRPGLLELHPILASRRVDQGDPIETLVFSVSTAKAAETLREEF